MGEADNSFVNGSGITSVGLERILGTAMAEHIHAVVRQLFQLPNSEAVMYELIHTRMSGTYELRLYEPRRSIMYVYEKHIIPPAAASIEPQHPTAQQSYRHLDLG